MADRVDAAIQRAQAPRFQGAVDRPSPYPEINHLAARDYSVLPRRQIAQSATWAGFAPYVVVNPAHPARVADPALQRGYKGYFRRKALMRSAYWDSSRA